MPTSGQITLQQAHDLALLYLCLACGTDARLVSEEQRMMASKLRQWLPNHDPSLIEHVTREAMLSYAGGFDLEDLGELLTRLASLLTEDRRRHVLRDLAAIAAADGTVQEAEQDFIVRVAKAWDMSTDSLLL